MELPVRDRNSGKESDTRSFAWCAFTTDFSKVWVGFTPVLLLMVLARSNIKKERGVLKLFYVVLDLAYYSKQVRQVRVNLMK